MKYLVILLFLVLFSCDDKVCYECEQHYEIIAVWGLNGENLNFIGFPIIEDTSFVFCDVTTQDINRIETLGAKDTLWIYFGNVLIETTLNTKCEEL